MSQRNSGPAPPIGGPQLVLHDLTKWDKRFLRVALDVSTWSKDPRCKVGCVYTRDRRILSTGYNGLPRGVNDKRVETVTDSIAKQLWFEHAERNGIYNAAYDGIALAGSTCYTIELPCAHCARAIIQCGVVRVVLGSPVDGYAWTDPEGTSGMATRELLWEANVVIVAPKKRLYSTDDGGSNA